MDEIVACGWTCRFFFSVAVVWDNGKKVPWRRRLKLCGCTISLEFSTSYDIWKFFIPSHFLSSVYLSLMIHYGRMWVFPNKQHIAYECTNYGMHRIPLLSNSSFFKEFLVLVVFDTFNSFCRFFWVQISIAWFFQFLKSVISIFITIFKFKNLQAWFVWKQGSIPMYTLQDLKCYRYKVLQVKTEIYESIEFYNKQKLKFVKVSSFTNIK